MDSKKDISRAFYFKNQDFKSQRVEISVKNTPLVTKKISW